MVQGSMIKAEIEAPAVVEIPRRRKTVSVTVRVSLMNEGEVDFVAHAEHSDDRHFWHVFDQNHRELIREPGKGKGGHKGVLVKNGVHSYRTTTVAAGHGLNTSRELRLDATKLAEGQTYTIRSETYGHIAETTFVALAEPRPMRAKRPGTAKKAPARARKKAK